MLELTLSILTAQAAAPPTLDGITGAGWVGTGLLSSVLAWIFFQHIPAKDKQIASLIETRDALVTGLSTANQEAMKAMAADFRAGIVDSERRADAAEKERREDYRDSLQMVIGHYEKELSVTNAAIRRDLDQLKSVLDQLNSVQDDLRKMILEIRDKNMQLWSAPEPRRRPGSNPPPAAPGSGR